MKTLNIIGCGNVGRTLARLWTEQNVFHIEDICNRSLASATDAVTFIRAGSAKASIREMTPADIFLIACSDDQIANCCQSLANAELLQPGNIVFHCSGMPSSELLLAKEQGACIASVHPVKSFVHSSAAAGSFDGTFCGTEGDRAALSILEPAFEAIGGKIFSIDPNQKSLYHAGTVIVCNYVNALLEVGLQAYEKAGIERKTAMQIIQPLVQGTVENIFKLGTSKALTGPIARGDTKIVQKHLCALSVWNKKYESLYRSLGEVTLSLSAQKGASTTKEVDTLFQLLS
jgi:predicted short-subunit dehydrogenase-like oxidoreductase (DUF2520 family)